MFKWTVPQQLRHYIPSDAVKGKPWDTDNLKDCFIKIDENEYRYPGWFNGSVGKMMQSLNVLTLSCINYFALFTKNLFCDR